MADTLLKLLEDLKKSQEKGKDGDYLVPSCWVPVNGEAQEREEKEKSVNPFGFLISHIEAILKQGKEIPEKSGESWIEHARIYNMFPRLAAAYDHDGDGVIGGSGQDITLGKTGYRETGTFLKAIAMLGHIRSLGCNVLYFLPITAIGQYGNKGDLGSPYAIRNPYRLDERLRDPLSSLTLEEQFRALVEACRLLDIKVIMEFVFRTGSKDADWAKEHPHWFYWIDKNIPERTPSMSAEESGKAYGNPIFSKEELEIIKSKVHTHDFRNLPAPPAGYRRMFKLPPGEAADVKTGADGKYIGFSKDPETGESVETTVPGAFADWPPDDVQPPWNDVTYLKLYKDEDPENPRFNYIAYNTIRMYDADLARPELAQKDLWEKIIEIIPHYQKEFGINGVMVDMGHALPADLMTAIIDKARKEDPDFAFLSENFSIDRHSADTGYNAVLGYSWSVEYKREGLLGLLRHAGIDGMPIRFFATAESHNTPRAAARFGTAAYSKAMYIINAFVPNGIPFIHNGYELGETRPVNTGLDFSPEDLEEYRGKALPLFDRGSLNWQSGSDICRLIGKTNQIREKHINLVDGGRFEFVDTGNDELISFALRGRNEELVIVVNTDYHTSQKGVLEESFSEDARDLMTGEKPFRSEYGVEVSLEPGEGCVIYNAWQQ